MYNVIKSLSDTELMVIAKELLDPNTPNKTIVNQLVAKSNNPTSEMSILSISFGVSLELSDRLMEDKDTDWRKYEPIFEGLSRVQSSLVKDMLKKA